MKKWIVVAVIVVAGGYWAVRKWPDLKTPAKQSTLASRPTTAVVERRNINFTVTAAGEIGPSEQVSVRPEVNGKIKDLPVDLGDKIKKGVFSSL